MTDRILFCHENKTNKQQSDILNKISRERQDIDMIPVYCMKLCFLCHSQYVVALNDSLIVSPNKEELLMKIEKEIKG